MDTYRVPDLDALNEMYPAPTGFDRLGQTYFSPIVRQTVSGTYLLFLH